MTRWTKRNIIISTINWWAKHSLAFFLILITGVILSCKKEGDFNLGNKKTDSEVGVLYTTTTLVNSTLLLNDSLASGNPGFLTFGGFSDTYTGNSFAEAYCRVGLFYEDIDYTGVTVDSANLYMYYTYAYGDTLTSQEVSVHQITTELNNSVPYKTTSNFVTYDATDAGSVIFQARPYTNHILRIPLTQAFGSTLLSLADDKSSIDFQSSFYGIMLKAENESLGSALSANYSIANALGTRLIVYFKRGNAPDSAAFSMGAGTPAFNKIYSNRAGSAIAGLVKTQDSITAASAGENCFVQSGTGVVTKVSIPDLATQYASGDGYSIVINKALLTVPIDASGNITRFLPTSPLALLQLNPNNTYNYSANGALAFIQLTGATQTTTGYAVTSTANSASVAYTFDITGYIQAILNGKLKNNGFIIIPTLNSYLLNRSVLTSSAATDKPMKLEIYYTKVK